MAAPAGWLAPAGLAVVISACAGPAGSAGTGPGPPRPPTLPTRLVATPPSPREASPPGGSALGAAPPPGRSAHGAAPPPGRSAPEDVLILSSDLGDPIGEGRYQAFEYPDAQFAVIPDDRPEDVTLTVRAGAEHWSIRLAAPLGQALDVGSFLNAERAPGSLTPGLDVRGDGRGCEQTFGAFTVSEVGFDQIGHLAALDATLSQHCEFPDAPALNATITYRAVPGA